MTNSYLRRILDDQEAIAAQEMQAKYRMVLVHNPTGRAVLTDILETLSFFSTLNPDSPGQIALHNAAKTLLANCGILISDNTRAITEALCNTPTEGG